MKTWETRSGEFVSEKPKEYLVALDAHGEKVFIGDRMIWNKTKSEFNVDETTWLFQIRLSVLKKKH